MNVFILIIISTQSYLQWYILFELEIYTKYIVTQLN